MSLKFKIKLASTKYIEEEMSFGEITNADTLNYRTLKPVRGGLADAVIFGPERDYECTCGKYERVQNRKACELCGTEIIEKIHRRRRMAHIKLAVPVAHIWMFKVSPSRIALMLDVKPRLIEEIVYFNSYIFISKGKSQSKLFEKKDVLSISTNNNTKVAKEVLTSLTEEIINKVSEKDSIVKREGYELLYELKEKNKFIFDNFIDFINDNNEEGIKIGTGAEALEILLKEIDLKELIAELKIKILKTKSLTGKHYLLKRLSLTKNFLQGDVRPEDMILNAIPVIPPALRPISQITSGKIVESELNSSYQWIIRRNEKLKEMLADEFSVRITIDFCKRSVQEAVDTLFDNERRDRPEKTSDQRIITSLSSVMKGKKGLFRQNILGKRVDYSGRSVITVGPTLKLNQCGIPEKMALTLFTPFLIARLLKNGFIKTEAEKLIEKGSNYVLRILKDILKEHPVLLNRAPTLHRLSIQAFYATLIKGKRITINPLVTTPFNADFDGDNMAVHVPLSKAAILECKKIIISTNNILSPKDGTPILAPTQDIVLGLYYLTSEDESKKNSKLRVYVNYNQVMAAFNNKKITLNEMIVIKFAVLAEMKEDNFLEKNKDKFFVTTVGKIIFNKVLPTDFPFINKKTDIFTNNDFFLNNKERVFASFSELEKNQLSHYSGFNRSLFVKIISYLFNNFGRDKTVIFLDEIKNLGFYYATFSGVSFSLNDIKKDLNKDIYIKEAEKQVDYINKNDYFKRGFLSNDERREKVIKILMKVKEKVQTSLKKDFIKDKTNSLFKMWDSDAKGSFDNYTQIIAMRGLVSNSRGETIEFLIHFSLLEGLSAYAYFFSIHGSRKGLVDTALKTSDAGYLTRRLVDVSHEVIATLKDCKTEKGFLITAITDNKYKMVISSLRERIYGRVISKDIIFTDTKTLKKTVLIKKNTVIDNKELLIIKKFGIKTVNIFSVLTCEADLGVCQKCYGFDMSKNKLVKCGEAVGVIAAQSIGEPGTQLTMRTFHTGGFESGVDITKGLPRIKELFDVVGPKGLIANISHYDGIVTDIIYHSKKNIKVIIKTKDNDLKQQLLDNNFLRVKVGKKIKIGEKLTDGNINLRELLEYTSETETQKYILKEVQRTYVSQGIQISDKHIEVIIKQMFQKVRVIKENDSDFFVGEIISKKVLKKISEELSKKGKKPPLTEAIILGIKQASLKTDSFLSAASFQETPRILTEAILAGKVDNLLGIKENLIVGEFIPAGTKFDRKKKIKEIIKDLEKRV